jgi:hypothetical protein
VQVRGRRGVARDNRVTHERLGLLQRLVDRDAARREEFTREQGA